ncbi:hypothetical protein E8E12_008207 [Didymella heteroderae]|uniref:Uncharacterized protein n=1 Tax=Didymella heteroderae TaxID=1769908 RepID=A0A9P4WMY8_9PLEO|nr:hypothetical protein E8E12_008207 [Didymella heteroderae]
MHFITSISLASSLVVLTGAVPTLTERSASFCPGQSYLTSEVKCSSGFIGCVAYDRGSEICNGQKRFFNDCSGASGLGSFFNCANGFKGCSTNPRICDNKSSTPADVSLTQTPSVVPSIAPGTCRPGEGTFYNCANGFKGCSTDPTVCDPKSNNKTPGPAPQAPNTCQSWEGVFYKCANGFEGCSTDPTVCDKPSTVPTPPSTGSDCPAGSSFYVCAINGFRGCSADPKICDAPSAPAKPKPSDTTTLPPTTAKCPKDTWYVAPNECSSGFVGCTGSQLGEWTDVCPGEKKFWGSCPPKHGNYYNCANGFVGCTTDVGVCDKKSQ